ncbi:hypothetical protein [Nonomuraea sp. NPDC049758]|uniref:hypothetical protein n=1 Tax=Nonomuraea sp. NPDC049758 TaxID=3154360 RepID=UPI00342F262E
MGTATVCAQIAAFTGVAERHSGLPLGLADTCFAVGAALGVAIAGSVVAAHAPTPGIAAPQTLVPGHQAAFGMVASSRHWTWSSLWPCSASDRHRSPRRPRRLPADRIVTDRIPA